MLVIGTIYLKVAHYQIFTWLDRDVPRRGIFAAPGDLR